jgi:hypothetical protein
MGGGLSGKDRIRQRLGWILAQTAIFIEPERLQQPA